MDIAVTSPRRGSETPHHTYNALHLNAEQSSPPAQQRRHVHYSTPQSSAPLSPRLIYETAVNSTLRSSPNGNRSTSSMSRTSSATPPRLGVSAAQSLSVTEGQNYDRMETDLESDGSSSEEGAPELPEGVVDSSLMEVEPPEDGEIMDTRPDSVTPESPSIIAGVGIAAADGTPAADAPIIGNPDLVRISSNGSSIESSADALTLPDVINARAIHPSAPSAPASTPQPLPTDGIHPTRTPGQPASSSNADTQAAVVRVDEDDSQEEDSDEEDVPYWANLKEDDSQPDEQELKVMQDTPKELSAIDHDHWERVTYEPLDDPEYIPGESGRITWTVKGVNGTPEKPNRQMIMRSPSVSIGGYYWNIKYFPRGDEGTQYMSVFVECSTTPRKEASARETKIETSFPEKSDNRESSSARTTEEPSSSANFPDPLARAAVRGTSLSSDASEGPLQVSPVLQIGAVSNDHVPETERQWEVAAQVGCVVYNPEEPRVHASQTSSHHFYNEYPDFGWIRFHGPWDEIHKRQRCQRQALLRNDTLVFTAYIRIVKDDTRALWWHAPRDSNKWDSLARTGLRQFTTGGLNSSAIISAISAWLNLGTIADLILNMHIPDPVEEPKSRPRPLFLALQHVVSDYFNSRNPREPEASLDGVIKAMDWYGAELDSKMDVVAIWETMRRMLNYEASDTVNVADAPDLFRKVLMLKQPDPWRDEQPIIDGVVSPELKQPSLKEPHSVQEAFDLATSGESRNFTGWEGIAVEQQNLADPPSVLQIELRRQSYNKELRQWRKLTHQVKINDTLTISSSILNQKLEYTLKSIIVHSGDLESKKYSAIVRRPQKDGATWVKFAGEQEEKGVTYTTTKQAIASHEGKGTQATGDAAVAYVVLYERTNPLSRILLATQTHLDDSELAESSNATVGNFSGPELNQGETAAGKHINERTVLIHVYPSATFTGYAGRGFLDAGRWPGHGAFELNVHVTTTVGELRKYIIAQATSTHKAEKPRQIRFWALDFGIRYTRGSPMMLPPNGEQWAGLSLDEFGRNVGGCHFWLHELPMPAEDTSMTSNEEADPQPSDATTTNVGSNLLEGAEVSEVSASGDPASGLIVEGEQSQHASQTTSGFPENEDTVMDGVSESAALVSADVPVMTQTGPPNPEEAENEAYIFLKIFNHQDQTLLGKGSYIIQRQGKIKDTIRKLLGPDCPDSIDIYQEQYLTISDDDLIQDNQTFLDVDVCAGDIFIAHHRPSAAESKALESSGKCATLMSYFKYLRRHDDPSYALSRHVSSYFSSPYLSTAQSSGRPHGPGTHISLAGDAYVGTFTAGTKSGHGTMAFSNGDTYTGSWADDEPNGQGKMVYAGTGNTYVGGFRKRKRHGKGTMTFEVADEEQQLCRICYEQEMDALFYDCGHVAACVECARQVSGCPVCRKGVRAVVRIWRT